MLGTALAITCVRKNRLRQVCTKPSIRLYWASVTPNTCASSASRLASAIAPA